ncbi:YcxB family protein [Streptomyces sp. NPDC048191]|uniref:YcxB family protein n=1 Tax=Streptomyces sp. NPDC048191 TaxID=3155484 RepID=UPI003409CF70
MVMDMGRGAVQEVVELRYRPEVADLTSALRARLRVSRVGRVHRWMPYVTGFFALVEIVSLARGDKHFSPGVLVSMVVATAALALSPWLQARAFQRLAEQRGVFRATVTESGVSVATDHTTASAAWAAQPRYRETARVFVLFSADKNATTFTTLPKSGLSGPADVDRLRAILDRHLSRV